METDSTELSLAEISRIRILSCHYSLSKISRKMKLGTFCVAQVMKENNISFGKTVRILCRECLKTKHQSLFGHQSRICKSCVKKRTNAHKRKRERSNGDLQINPWYSRVCAQIKYRAKEIGTPYNLTPTYLRQLFVPNVCPVLGIPLYISKGRPTDNSPSIDRIIPALGYTRGNVRVISFRANTLKRNATLGELRLLLQDMERTAKAGTLFAA